MKHPLQEMMDKRRQGIRCGIPSYCSANELVIEIALRRAKERNIPVLIEATANQDKHQNTRKHIDRAGGFHQLIRIVQQESH